MPDESRATPRDFLAVERTFLAWIRTGLALMGLGFVLARFGIFLREFNLNQPNLPSYSFGLSLWFGTTLIFLGVLVCLLSLVRYPSNHSVEETVTRLQGIFQAKDVKLFTIVDHSGEAATAGLKMPNTKLLIFGNPKAGTPLMLASPSAALDLPLKILVAEDAAGKVWISYNASAYLQARHKFPSELLPNIAVIETLAAKAAE